ncbi:hypothetical protein NHX12_021109 [Muraenolepis orangiensis]|uniref:Ig-like domain-containing protein n=1 Tax=Muraenolepis orangiensis TaxID=630683 RepID=A0A9Q0ERJ6_9TELE|nr:hypothetical protein NHX12_021109 [Muraenolepis orangiensis]
MPLIHTRVWLLLFFIFVGSATQDKTPDTHVTCVISEDCALPCAFQPSSHEVIRWFRGSVHEVLVHSFRSADSAEEEDGEDEEEDKEDEEGAEDGEEDDGEDEPGPQKRGHHYDGRTSLFPEMVALGNATLVLKGCGPKDRGRYRCHVRTMAGIHESNVLVKVEAPLRILHMELSRLSGFEEIKCTARHVYPAPHLTWETDPPASQLLRPITRKLADKQTGLYMVESRLRRSMNHPEITYICKVTSSYGAQSWTASLRERAEISGPEGRDISIPCHAPARLHNPLLSWTFTHGLDPASILTYDSQSQRSSVSSPWEGHVEMDANRVLLGDGSLRLLGPDHDQHTGVYTCVFSAPYRTHTEETEVTISPMGSFATPRKQLEQPTEMHSVKVSTPAEMNPGGETSPLTGPDTQRQTTDTPSGET